MDSSGEGGGGGRWRTQVGIVYTQQKGKKISEKCLNIFTMQKCSYGDKHFFIIVFNQIANTQKIAGWYKVYIQGISKPNEKQKMKAVSIGFLLHTLFKASCNFFLLVTKGNKSYKNPSTSFTCWHALFTCRHANTRCNSVDSGIIQARQKYIVLAMMSHHH